MAEISDKKKLEMMDQAIHELWRTNPIAHELKRATHKHGGEKHNLIMATAFTGMQHLLGRYAELYEVARIEAEAAKAAEVLEIPANEEAKDDTKKESVV